jgi:hypothetical protein
MRFIQPETKETAKRVASAPVKKHPNASLAATVGSVSTLVLWIAGAIGIAMSAEAGAAAATLLVAGSLLVGKKGIRGLIGSIWKGSDNEE